MGHSSWTKQGPTKAFGGHAPFGRTKRRAITGPTGHLARLEPFEGFSMRAEWLPGRSHQRYIVYSYSTVIAIYVPNAAATATGALYLNGYHYSSKTSEHQCNAAAWLGRAILDLSTVPVVECHDEDDTIVASYRL